jgi:hypothetical protein
MGIRVTDENFHSNLKSFFNLLYILLVYFGNFDDVGGRIAIGQIAED